MPAFDFCLQRISRPKTKLPPDGTGKHHLPFAGNRGFQGKTFLPFSGYPRKNKDDPHRALIFLFMGNLLNQQVVVVDRAAGQGGSGIEAKMGLGQETVSSGNLRL